MFNHQLITHQANIDSCQPVAEFKSKSCDSCCRVDLNPRQVQESYGQLGPGKRHLYTCTCMFTDLFCYSKF